MVDHTREALLPGIVNAEEPRFPGGPFCNFHRSRAARLRCAPEAPIHDSLAKPPVRPAGATPGDLTRPPWDACAVGQGKCLRSSSLAGNPWEADGFP